MQIDVAVVFWVVIVVLLLSFLKAEKLVKITFWSYVLLVFCLALGICILQWAAQLQWIGNQTILGVSYSSIGEFLVNAQPTIMIVLYLLWLWFFAMNSHLSIQFSWEMFEKKIQTLLRCVLCMWSILSAVYFPLSYFKGEVYEFIFNNSYIIWYSPMIPIATLVSALLTILAASHLNLKIALKMSGSSWA
jgi:hypothetical protein